MIQGSINIDDAGNPDSGSEFLSETRKSWTAVIIPSSVARDVSTEMDSARLVRRGQSTGSGRQCLSFLTVRPRATSGLSRSWCSSARCAIIRFIHELKMPARTRFGSRLALIGLSNSDQLNCINTKSH
jgi:hypothetical protein